MNSTVPSKLRPGKATSCASALWPGCNQAEILLLHLGDEPEIGEIRRFVERLSRLDAHAFLRRLLDHDAIRRRAHGNAALRLAGLAQARDLILRHIERAQPLQRSGGERAGIAMRHRRHAAAHARGDEIFLFGRTRSGA